MVKVKSASLFSALLVSLGFARVPDLCPGYGYPDAIGETDGNTVSGCLVSLASGFFVGSSTYSTLLSGVNYGTPALTFYDSNMEVTSQKLLEPTGASDFNDLEACTADAANNKLAMVTDGDHYVVFYQEGGTPTLFTLNYSGFPYSDYGQGIGGLGEAMAYKDGILYLWMGHDSFANGPHLFRIQDSGSIDFVFQESEATDYQYLAFNVVVDWANDFILASMVSYPAYPRAQQTSLYDTTGSGSNLWIEAEESSFVYINLVADYDDFVYFQCGIEYGFYDLQLLALELDSTYPHNIIDHSFAWVDQEGFQHHTCNGVKIKDGISYVLLRYDDGTMYVLAIDLDNATQTDIRFDGNFRDGGYDEDVFATFLPSQNSVFDETNLLFYFQYTGNFNGNKEYSDYHNNIIAMDNDLNCNQDFSQIATEDIFSAGEMAGWFSGEFYEDYTGYFTATDDTANWSLGTTGTASVVDFKNEMSELKVCEITEAPSAPVDGSYPEQVVQTHTHVAYDLEMTDCPTSDAFITYYPVKPDDSPLDSSWVTYDSATRTFSTVYLAENGDVDIKLRASTDALLSVDEDHEFNLELTQFNYPPTMSTLVDVECEGFSTCSQTVTVDDIDPADVLTKTAQYYDDVLATWIPTTDPTSLISYDSVTGLIEFPLPDNSYEGRTFIVEVEVEDDDSDATGSTNTVTNNFNFNVNLSDQTTPPRWLTTFNHQYFMNLGYNFPFQLPTYAAPDIIDQQPQVTLTWREGTELVPMPPIFKGSQFEKQPYQIDFSAVNPSDLGKYDFDINIKIKNYGTLSKTFELNGSFTIVVTNLNQCEQAYYKKESSFYVYEGEHQVRVRNLPDTGACQGLGFSFTLTDGESLPEGFYSSKSTLYFESNNPEVAGEYEFKAYMRDQAIGLREFDQFKVIVKAVQVIRPEVDNSFRLPPGEAPLAVEISEVSDDGEATLQANKILQDVEDLSVFSGRTEAFEFSIVSTATAQQGEGRRLQLLNQGYEQYRNYQVPQNETEVIKEENEEKEDEENSTQYSTKEIIPYTVISMKGDQIRVLLDYPNLHSISKDGSSVLQVEVINTLFLVSTEGERLVAQGVAQKEMPEQFERGDKEIFDQLGQLIVVMFYLVTITTLLLSFFSYSSTQALWIYLATFQYIAHFPLIAEGFPINISYLMSKIVDFLNFKFFKLDNVWGIKAKEINELGYSSNFIFSLKSSLVFFIYTLGALTLLFLLHKAILKNVRGLRNANTMVKRQLFMNFPIRYLMQTFLCYSLAAFYNARDFSFSSMGNILGGSVSVIVILLYTSFLFVIIWFLLHNRFKLRREHFVHKVGTLYQEVRTTRVGSILYTEIFLITRYFFAAIVVLLAKTPALQIAPVAFLTTLQAFYSFQCQPFTSRWLNIFDFINQATAAALSYMIISFTDYNRNYASQYKFGKFYISIFLVLYIVNCVFVFFRAVILFLIDMKRRRQQKNLEAVMKGPDLFDHIGQMSQDWEKGPQYIKQGQSRKDSIISKSERQTSQSDSELDSSEDTENLQDSIQRLNETGEDEGLRKSQADLGFPAKKKQNPQDPKQDLRATSRGSFRNSMPVNPNKSFRNTFRQSSMQSSLAQVKSEKPKEEEKKEEEKIDTQRTMGAKSISSVVNVQDVNPAKPKPNLAETFGQTLFKKPQMKRMTTAVLDQTNRGGFFKKSEVPKEDEEEEEEEKRKSNVQDDVRLVSLNSKGFQNMLGKFYK